MWNRLWNKNPFHPSVWRNEPDFRLLYGAFLIKTTIIISTDAVKFTLFKLISHDYHLNEIYRGISNKTLQNILYIFLYIISTVSFKIVTLLSFMVYCEFIRIASSNFITDNAIEFISMLKINNWPNDLFSIRRIWSHTFIFVLKTK